MSAPSAGSVWKRFLGFGSKLSVIAVIGGLMWLGHALEWRWPHGQTTAASEASIAKRDNAFPSTQPASQAEQVNLASRDTVDKVHLHLGTVQSVDMAQYVLASGVIAYERPRLAMLSPRVAGVVWEAQARVGDRVREGQTLAIIESPEVGKAKTEFMQALVQSEMHEKLANQSKQAEDVISQRHLLEREASLREARLRVVTAQQALVNLGLPIEPDSFRGLSERDLVARVRSLGLPEELPGRVGPAAANLLVLRAPFSGQVVSSEFVKGEALSAGQPKITLADTSRLWVVLEVPADDAPRLALGQEVLFKPDGADGEELRTAIDWISPEVDPKTRRVKVRAELGNRDGSLRANTFGSGRIKVRPEAHSLAVSSEAVHFDVEQQAHVVFVCRDEQNFVPCRVRPGARRDGLTEIAPLDPLPAGTRVATEGSYVLKSELLRRRLASAQ